MVFKRSNFFCETELYMIPISLSPIQYKKEVKLFLIYENAP